MSITQSQAACRAPLTCERLRAARARLIAIKAAASAAGNTERWTQAMVVQIRIEARLEMASYFPFITSALTAYKTGVLSEGAKAAYMKREVTA